MPTIIQLFRELDYSSTEAFLILDDNAVVGFEETPSDFFNGDDGWKVGERLYIGDCEWPSIFPTSGIFYNY